MTRRHSRRDFFTSWFSSLSSAADAARPSPAPDPETALRPPGALVPDPRFLEACTGCEECVPAECVPACPTSSIVMLRLDEDRTVPGLTPAAAPCRLCTELPCIEACPDGALESPGGPMQVRMGIARVNPRRCVTFKGQPCDACYAACPYPSQAIMMIGGRPLVASGACTGCGLCEHACPEHPRAITVIAERHLVPGLRVPREEHDWK
jgi:ferredoxin